MPKGNGIYSNDRDVGAPKDGSILAAEETRENSRSVPGAFHIPGPRQEAGPQAGLRFAPAEGGQSREQRNFDNEADIVVEGATVHHDDVVHAMIRDENCAAYIYGRKFNLFILILPCLAVIGACIAIPFVILDRARRWNQDNSHSRSESRCEEIRKVVSSVSTSESLDDTSSSQNRALEWLCFHDESELPSNEQQEITQRYILAVLYYSLGGSDWTVDCDFLSAAHVCDWFDIAKDDKNTVMGVTDCNEDLKVTTIVIHWNNMHGTLPDEVQFLTSLENFGLVGGPLHGTIPEGIGNLVNLKNINFMENRLSGTVPESLSKLINLEYVTFSINENLTGDLDFLCPLENMINMSADCGGADLKVTCSCCDSCCAATEHECCVVKSLPWADIGYCFPTLPPALQDVDNPFSD
mmetsp:Transcript_48209/g.72894  ORF Transcript_48209/g.72894 Transcript_48209/m.72894 type:complete len:410 (-) Transcript_48209:158-1387(-)